MKKKSEKERQRFRDLYNMFVTSVERSITKYNAFSHHVAHYYRIRIYQLPSFVQFLFECLVEKISHLHQSFFSGGQTVS